jgi:hypothetical protein
VYEGVCNGKFGSVVAIVAEMEEKNAAGTSGDAVVLVEFWREYSPIMGGSLVLIP